MEVNVLELVGIIDSGTSVMVLLFLVYQCQKGDENHTGYLRERYDKISEEYAALVQVLMASLQSSMIEAERRNLRDSKDE